MTHAVRQQLPPTATDVDLNDYGTDLDDPFACIAAAVDLVMLDVLISDFTGDTEDDDHVAEDYRYFVGL